MKACLKKWITKPRPRGSSPARLPAYSLLHVDAMSLASLLLLPPCLPSLFHVFPLWQTLSHLTISLIDPSPESCFCQNVTIARRHKLRHPPQNNQTEELRLQVSLKITGVSTILQHPLCFLVFFIDNLQGSKRRGGRKENGFRMCVFLWDISVIPIPPHNPLFRKKSWGAGSCFHHGSA